MMPGPDSLSEEAEGRALSMAFITETLPTFLVLLLRAVSSGQREES